jgi:hypothetical protein
MDLLEDMREQRAVYWPPGPLDQNGQHTFLEPVEILVRWEQSGEIFLDRQGNEQVSRAEVYVGELPEGGEVEELGALWLSSKTIDDADGSGLAEIVAGSETDPFLNEGAYEIRKFVKYPAGVEGATEGEFLRQAYL